MWERIKSLPAGVWLALSAACTIFILVLRGRRIEAELAHTKTSLEAARARAEISKNQANADEHFNISIRHAERVEELEAARALVRASSAEAQKRLASMPPSKIQDEYVRLARERLQERLEDEKRFGPRP
jgi:multidrug efflux pump subunit AcrA (membrane-fusion protein)